MGSRMAGTLLTPYDLMNGMRALAAITVLFSHERDILFLEPTAELSIAWKFFYFMTGFGHQAVMIFFVLSGYWITKTVARLSGEGGFSWRDYAIDRLSRLWIVLIPALLLGGVLDSVGRYGTAAPMYLGLQGARSLTFDVAARLSLSNLAGNLAFLQGMLVEEFGSNGPLWSLANEFWYYFWFPPLYQILRGQRPSIAVTLLVLVTMVAFRSLLPLFVCWLFGSILYYTTRRPSAQTAAGRGMFIARVAALLFFIGVMCLSRMPHLPIDQWVSDVAVSGSFALLLFVIVRSAGTYPHSLTQLCRYGAGSSYSLYVAHFPLVALLAALFVTPAQRLPPSGGLLLGFIAITFVAIIYGFALSSVTEAKTPGLRRWLKDKYSKPSTRLQDSGPCEAGKF